MDLALACFLLKDEFFLLQVWQQELFIQSVNEVSFIVPTFVIVVT